ncbi:PKD domain-containing protein [Desulfogranum marinum]|uniref:PKD domain-containing protein n=1 Tax=Desulfogranum marinum TaxID=453220 RepID=UPI0019647569|nr:PKD domain-containing protein [Desulfogranum marinum]MBM9513982.1 PKD domain-containing protein [Desulfogranum marinum]
MKYRINKLKKHLGLKKNSLSYLIGSLLSTCILAAPVTTPAAENLQGNLTGVSITDADGANIPPVAKITYIQDDDTFTFDASDSYDPDGEILEYKWDFGDGNNGTGISVSHKYTDITPDFVSLTILDNSKGVTISQQQIATGNCQSADISYITTDATTPDIYSDTDNDPKTVSGQSFTPVSTGEIYAIKVALSYVGTTPGTLKMRVGNTADLSTIYDTEETVDISGYKAGDTVEVVFASPPSMATSKLKYFMVFNDGNYNTRFKLNRDNYGGYAKGDRYLSSTGLANVDTTFGDLSFEVMVCD